jgi:hypothetical protein
MLRERLCTLGILLLLLFTSCNGKSDNMSADLPGITIPLTEMNTEFVIEDLPIIANSHENGKDLALVLRNRSDKTIIFPIDYGMKIFTFRHNAWDSVSNGFLYTGGEKLLPTSEAFPPGLMATAYPYIPGLLESTGIRIVMVGYIEGSVEQKVGAYIDISLLP